MEKFIKITFKISFFIAVFMLKDSGEFLILSTLLYFPMVYAASYIDANKYETATA